MLYKDRKTHRLAYGLGLCIRPFFIIEIVLKLFLDNNDIMYEGSLRYHESDINKKQTICLSGYRRYIKENGKYVVKQDYNNDNSRWVMLDISEITRVEIKYHTNK